MAIMPLTHEEARRDLHTGRRWLDNKALAALDAHLAECPACRAYALDLARLEPALSRALHARWDNVQPPRPQPAEQAAPPRSRPRRLSPAFAFGAVTVLLALSVVLLPAVLAPPPAATPGPVTVEGVTGLPSPTPYADLNRALFAADRGAFSGPPAATLVEAEPRVLAWDPISDQLLWSVGTGREPQVAVDSTGRYVFVLSQVWTEGRPLTGQTFDFSSPSANPDDAWPLTLTVLDAATGTTEQSVTLPPDLGWLRLVGASEANVYLYRFSVGTLDRVDLATGIPSDVHITLCTDAYPQAIQLAPEGGAAYALCTPQVASAAGNWVQLTRFDGAEPVRVPLPPIGPVTRWGNGLLLSLDGTRLYLADTHQGLLAEIDTASGAVLRTTRYSAGAPQRGQYEALLALSPNGRFLFLGAIGGNEPDRQIWAVDTSSFDTVGRFNTAPAIPRALAVDRSGNLLMVSDQGVATVNMLGSRVVSLSTSLPATIAQLVPNPGDIPILAATPLPNVPIGLNLLAFIRDDDLYLANADGSSPRPLVQRPGPERAPTWSPDGRYLAFIAGRGDAADIMVLNVANALTTSDLIPPVRVWQGSTSVTLDEHLAWSPDGTRLAISFWPQKGPGTTGSVIQLLDVTAALSGVDSLLAQQLVHRGSDPRFSPDGTRLLYTGPGDAGLPALFVEDLATGERLNLTAGQNAGPEAYYTTHGYDWDPSGQFIAYLRVGPWLGRWPDSTLSPNSHAQVVIGTLDGTGPTVILDLAPAPNGILGLEYSPDGRYLMFVSDRENNGCWNIHLLALADQALHRLEGVCYTARTALPSWSPDSRWLAFTAPWDAAGRTLELTALDTAQALFTLDASQRVVPVRLTTWVGDDLSPAWQPVCHTGIPNC